MRRAGVTFVALVLVAGSGYALWLALKSDGPPPLDPASLTTVFPEPAAGSVQPRFLVDGTPVWVAADADGRVVVLSAVSGHVVGVEKLTWWCPAGAIFEDPFHGSYWDARGRRLGGPTPRDLAAYQVVRAADGSVIVSAGSSLGPPAAGGDDPGEVRHCDQAGAVFHEFNGVQVWDSPADAAAAHPDGWALVRGALVADGAGGGILCPTDAEQLPCPGGVTARLGQPIATPRGGMADGPSTLPWLARFRDATVTELVRVIEPAPTVTSQNR